MKNQQGFFQTDRLMQTRGQHEETQEHSEDHGVYVCGSWEGMTVSNSVSEEYAGDASR